MLVMVMTALMMRGQYIVQKVSGDVKVEKSGKLVAVSKSQRLQGGEYVVIGRGGSVSVYSPLHKQIYTSTSEGRKNVLKRVIEARNEALSKSRTLDKYTGRVSEKGTSQRVYSRNGMTFRGVDSDPLDPQAVAYMLRNWEKYVGREEDEVYQVKFDYQPEQDNADILKMVNEMDGGLFFNVFRVMPDGHVAVETYSSHDDYLNNYLSPKQEWGMTWRPALKDSSRRIVLMTLAPYAVDEVLQELLLPTSLDTVPDSIPEAFIHAL